MADSRPPAIVREAANRPPAPPDEADVRPPSSVSHGTSASSASVGRPTIDSAIGLSIDSPSLSSPLNSLMSPRAIALSSMINKRADRFGFFREQAIAQQQSYSGAIDEEGVHISAMPSAQEIRLEALRLKKWMAMLKNWRSWEGTRKLKNRARKGVPDALRGLVWRKMCGADILQANNPGLYRSLLEREPAHGDAMCIAVDLPRTYPKHCYFSMADASSPATTPTTGLLANTFLSPGQQALRNVLWAYSVQDPQVGYCQGMAFVAGLLLVYLPEEEAFFTLTSLMKSDSKYRLSGLYSPGLPRFAMVMEVYDTLLKRFIPKVYNHLKTLGVDHSMYASQWFITVFSYSFSFSLVTRAWDCFMCEGWKSVFRVALALIKHHEKALLDAEFDQVLGLLKRACVGAPADEIIRLALSFKFSTSYLDGLMEAYQAQHKDDIARRVQEAQAEAARKEKMLKASMAASGAPSLLSMCGNNNTAGAGGGAGGLRYTASAFNVEADAAAAASTAGTTAGSAAAGTGAGDAASSASSSSSFATDNASANAAIAAALRRPSSSASASTTAASSSSATANAGQATHRATASAASAAPTSDNNDLDDQSSSGGSYYPPLEAMPLEDLVADLRLLTALKASAVAAQQQQQAASLASSVSGSPLTSSSPAPSDGYYQRNSNQLINTLPSLVHLVKTGRNLSSSNGKRLSGDEKISKTNGTSSLLADDFYGQQRSFLNDYHLAVASVEAGGVGLRSLQQHSSYGTASGGSLSGNSLTEDGGYLHRLPSSSSSSSSSWPPPRDRALLPARPMPSLPPPLPSTSSSLQAKDSSSLSTKRDSLTNNNGDNNAASAGLKDAFLSSLGITGGGGNNSSNGGASLVGGGLSAEDLLLASKSSSGGGARGDGDSESSSLGPFSPLEALAAKLKEKFPENNSAAAVAAAASANRRRASIGSQGANTNTQTPVRRVSPTASGSMPAPAAGATSSAAVITTMKAEGEDPYPLLPAATTAGGATGGTGAAAGLLTSSISSASLAALRGISSPALGHHGLGYNAVAGNDALSNNGSYGGAGVDDGSHQGDGHHHDDEEEEVDGPIGVFGAYSYSDHHQQQHLQHSASMATSALGRANGGTAAGKASRRSTGGPNDFRYSGRPSAFNPERARREMALQALGGGASSSTATTAASAASAVMTRRSAGSAGSGGSGGGGLSRTTSYAAAGSGSASSSNGLMRTNSAVTSSSTAVAAQASRLRAPMTRYQQQAGAAATAERRAVAPPQAQGVSSTAAATTASSSGAGASRIPRLATSNAAVATAAPTSSAGSTAGRRAAAGAGSAGVVMTRGGGGALRPVNASSSSTAGGQYHAGSAGGGGRR